MLQRTGHTVIVPADQVCCGIPALYLGDTAAFRNLRSKNIRAFSRWKLDAIVTGCASCGTALKEEYPRLREDGAAQPLGARVYDVSEFLVDAVLPARNEKQKVTYHDPCHLRSSQGIWKEPRKLLSQVADIVEADEPCRCCGGGGTFSIFYHKFSRAIGEEKSKALQETGTRTVVTGCPGCILQLRTVLPADFSVKHIVEILSSSAPSPLA